MRKNLGRIFAIEFLKSLLFLGLFIGISILSYNIVMGSYDYKEEYIIDTVPPIQIQKSITEARIDDVSKHLIFSIDEESGDIQKLLLEVFNCQTNRLAYITIPIKTQFTLSESLHRQLVLVKPSIPQFLKLSAITGYFPRELVYEYGVLMVEDLLDIQISYYSVVPQDIYDSVFLTEDIKGKYYDKTISESIYPREIFSDMFLEHLHTIKTETQLRDYIEEIYNQIMSNLSFKDKLNYMESYLKTPGKNISFEVIAGENSNSAYIIDQTKAALQLAAYFE